MSARKRIAEGAATARPIVFDIGYAYKLCQTDHPAWCEYEAPRYLDSLLTLSDDDKRRMFACMKGEFRAVFLRVLSERIKKAQGPTKRELWRNAGADVQAALRELAESQKTERA